MRGKDKEYDAEMTYVGITPAYAGKSGTVPALQSAFQDHPRLCGEKTKTVTELVTRLGSPPPMRGKEKLPKSGIVVNRITPAYAGKSRICRV